MNKPAFRYTGSKFRLADWVISHFPPHRIYVEPFAGAAAVFFRKQPAEVEVINDINKDIVNFFEMLRIREADLLRAIYLTPYARAEYEQAREWSDDPLERARRFYVDMCMAFNGRVAGSPSGWKVQLKDGGNGFHYFKELSHLEQAAARLKETYIECTDALFILNHYDAPDALFYIDPPYTMDERSHKMIYAQEMDNQEHQDLARALNAVAGYVVVSGYANALYDELYKGWHVVTKDTTTNGGKYATECLWLSPRTWAALDVPKQLSLLG